MVGGRGQGQPAAPPRAPGPPTRPKVLVLGPELKKPLKRLAARFFQLSPPPLLPLGREQLEDAGASWPGMLVSPRNSDMFFRRRPGAWPGRGIKARPTPAPTVPPHSGFPRPLASLRVGGVLHTAHPGRPPLLRSVPALGLEEPGTNAPWPPASPSCKHTQTHAYFMHL